MNEQWFKDFMKWLDDDQNDNKAAEIIGVFLKNLELVRSYMGLNPPGGFGAVERIAATFVLAGLMTAAK